MRQPLQGKGKTRYAIERVVCVAGCTIVNVVLFALMRRYELPLYMDTIGTVFVTLLGGAYPGIMTAVASSFLCSPFYEDALCYSLISVLIAISVSIFKDREYDKRRINFFFLLLHISFLGGALGMIFQLLLLGKPQFDFVTEAAESLAGGRGIFYYFYSLLFLLMINMVDKGLCLFCALVPYYLIPKNRRDKLWESNWKQRPLDRSEIQSINSRLKGGISIRSRMMVLLVTAALAITLILSWVSCRLYLTFMQEQAEERAKDTGAFIGAGLTGEDLESFLAEGGRAMTCRNPRYLELKGRVFDLCASGDELEAIDIFLVRDHKEYEILSSNEDHFKQMVIGNETTADEELIGPIVEGKKGSEGTLISFEGQSYYSYLSRICITEGGYSAFAEILIRFPDYTEIYKRFAINILLVFSGFLLLILAFSVRTTGQYLVFPIGSLEKSISGFIRGMDDQEHLDEGVKELRRIDIRTDDELEKLYKSICEMAVGTAEQMRSIRMLARSNEKMQSGLIITMADMVENRDSDTGAHIQKTAAYVRIILHGLKRKGYYAEKLTDKYMNDVEMSAPLHDIGKINVPDAVLNKPGKLTEEEFEIMKTHTTAGKKILENAISTVEGENYLKEARNMAAYHHERWDGKGYPEGLHGQVIPLSARVMAVADVFDALSSPRVYKPAFPLEKALEIIQEGSGAQFDPKCVEVFMEALAEVKKIQKKYQES
ncbi:MAG: HD domain-containing protein [Lachnospiraceae bacterium]|nr:HD domain-containing protein [Lachnospiraceae bacterium]